VLMRRQDGSSQYSLAILMSCLRVHYHSVPHKAYSTEGVARPHPSCSATKVRRSRTLLSGSGGNRNLVHRDCSAGMILLT